MLCRSYGQACQIYLPEQRTTLLLQKICYLSPPPKQMVDDVLGRQNCLAKSKWLNTIVNTFMELEKLTLDKTKWHKLHIGSNERATLNLDKKYVKRMGKDELDNVFVKRSTSRLQENYSLSALEEVITD